MQLRILSHRAPVVGAIVTLLLAACTAGASVSDEDLTVSVATPADGAEVSIPFEMNVESNAPLGEPETGNHHIHFYFDTDITSPDYQIVYGDSAEVARPLTPGEHTITASLRNADHTDAGPSETITVNVVEAGGEAGTEAAETDAGGETQPGSEQSNPPSDGGFFDY